MGVTDDGKLNGIKVTYYCDCGYAKNDCTVKDIMYMGDNGKLCYCISKNFQNRKHSLNVLLTLESHFCAEVNMITLYRILKKKKSLFFCLDVNKD